MLNDIPLLCGIKMIRIKVLAYTPNPERMIALAARQTRLKKDVSMNDIDDQRTAMLIRKLLSLKHLSPFEHASFTFLISGISRVCTHQLVRHRLASYSQQSQRMVKIDKESFIIPPSIRENKKALEVFQKVVDEAVKGYDELISLGIPLEDARYVIPQASETKIVVTMNARELLHFFGLRLCKKAQWEIRKVAKLMLDEVKEIAPNIFEKAGPRCWDYGYCPEGDDECFKEMIKLKPP